MCCCLPADTDGGKLSEKLLDSNEYQQVKHTYVKDEAAVPTGEPTGKSWYHGKISNAQAESRLKKGAKGNDGSYLVYDNPRHSQGQYILLVYYKGEQLRWKIQRIPSDGMYILGEDGLGVARYRTVRDLIKAHRGVTGRPIQLEDGRALTLSKCYVYIDQDV